MKTASSRSQSLGFGIYHINLFSDEELLYIHDVLSTESIKNDMIESQPVWEIAAELISEKTKQNQIDLLPLPIENNECYSLSSSYRTSSLRQRDSVSTYSLSSSQQSTSRNQIKSLINSSSKQQSQEKTKRKRTQRKVCCHPSGCSRISRQGGLCYTHGKKSYCIYIGCKKTSQKRGLCATHGGVRVCKIEGCKRYDRGGGLCGKHRKKKINKTQ